MKDVIVWMALVLYPWCSAGAQERLRSVEQRFREAATPTRTLAAAPAMFPDHDPIFPPPAGTTDAFKLSQAYPSEYNAGEHFPWEEIDFRVNPSGYLRNVLDYCIEGNVAVDFRGAENTVRKWYHAPWMHDDGRTGNARAGREFRHGMTRERFSRRRELHPDQSETANNWAVSMYNDRGGFVIGKIWLTADGFPDPSHATYPDNTVSFKLLFTTATVGQVPFLQDSKTWTANIDPPMGTTPPKRVDQELRLLQIDVAVKEPRVASTTGWVFGTFIYDHSAPGATEWDRMTPVGLSWGDDPGERRLMDREGSYVSPHLRETTLVTSLVEPPEGTPWGNRAYMRHFGLGGRLNGPVDNPASSCISCHGRAATLAAALPLNPDSGSPMPILAGSGRLADQTAQFDRFFRMIRGNSHLEIDRLPDGTQRQYVTVDYSLQISTGIRNFYQNKRSSAAAVAGLEKVKAINADAAKKLQSLPPLPALSRDEQE